MERKIISESLQGNDILSIENALELIRLLKANDDFLYCYNITQKYISKITSPKAFDYIIKYLEQKYKDTDNISYLYFSTDLIFYLLEKQKIYISELTMHKYILKDFNSIFPDFTLIKSEHKNKGGRVDIFAKEKDTLRDVIIELKKDDTDTSKQLFRYRDSYNNPRLISVTRKIPNKIYDDIEYYVFNNVIA